MRRLVWAIAACSRYHFACRDLVVLMGDPVTYLFVLSIFVAQRFSISGGKQTCPTMMQLPGLPVLKIIVIIIIIIIGTQRFLVQ